MKEEVGKKTEKLNAKERVAKSQEWIKEIREGGVKVEMIRALIPIALKAVEDLLQQEVTDLAGVRYGRGGKYQRWGQNLGSVYLGDQKVATAVPRLRDKVLQKEVQLKSYESLQEPSSLDQMSFQRLLQGISCRGYEKAVQEIPSTFGISKSRVSEHFIKESSKQLKLLQERDLSTQDWAVIMLDGKSFQNHQIITALGITIEGKKVILGLTEAASENHRVIEQFLENLKQRGISSVNGILFVVDGSKGLTKGIQKVFGKEAFIQRCQWHKRENVVSYLSKSQQAPYRKKLQHAYERATYKEAKAELDQLHADLEKKNLSAANSLAEGLEQTLTLHRLGVFALLGISLKTTNCLESIHSGVERLTERVSCWKDSQQRQRWVASALLDLEPGLRRIKGFHHLPLLRQAMKDSLQKQELTKVA